jgi:hypothetical protein
MTVREYVGQAIQNLNETELAELAEYVAFLRFRARSHAAPSFDPAEAARLYAEFAAEDRRMAEEGVGEYAKSLTVEDSQ